MAEPGVTIEPVPEDENSEVKLSSDAVQNFLNGKRHMIVHDYTNAVASLGDACELYVEHFGETALECGEVYFHYGKALFRLFQQQAGIIANIGSEDSSTTDEEPKVSDSEEDKEKENTENAETTSNEENEEEDNNDEDDDNDEEDIEEDETVNEESDSTAPEEAKPQEQSPTKENEAKIKETTKDGDGPVEASDSKPSDKDNETDNKDQEDSDLLNQAGPSGSRPKTEEEISDLQLAWETLETAKAVFTKHSGTTQDNRLKVGEILLILAEISMELENYSAAVDDLHECLAIREMYLTEDDRLIAETYYQLGLVYTFDSQVSEALSSYQKSIDCIMLRIENLKKETGLLKTPEGYDLLPAEEIKELEALLPDIKAKMEDTQDMVQDTKNLLLKELSMQNMEGAPGSSVSDKPVTNITHLLKRKKPDDQSSPSTSECKKIKLSNASTNGQDQVPVDAGQSSVTSEEASNV